MNNTALFNFAFSAAAFSLMLVCLLLTVTGNIERITKSFFMILFSILSLYTLSNIFIELKILNPGLGPIGKPALFFSLFFSSMLMPVIGAYLLYCCGEDLKTSKTLRALIGIWIVYAVLLISAQFTKVFYYYDDAFNYHRGPCYLILVIPAILIMLINLITLIRNKTKLSKKQFRAFLIYILVPTIALLLEMAFFGLAWILMGTTIAAFVLFMIIVIEQRKLEKERNEELLKQRASLTVLRMRPHFINNTLTSIYYLCDQDVSKAQEMILSFTNYLRKNFTALSKESLISITEEIEHAEAYLAIERVRFDDRLVVDFDIKDTNFRLPALTLQPLVTNSVQHGMTSEDAVLHVKIETHETENAHVLSVSDDGAGFDTSILENDKSLSYTLSNMKEHLALSCNGALEITSEIGRGTTATVTIPK